MGHAEIDSFVNKFKLLLNAGFNAKLNLESTLGEVDISLSCKVGRLNPPPSLPSMFFTSSPRHRSPSYLRRQARRKAAHESHMVKSHAADEVLGKNSSKIEQSIDDVVVNDSAVEAEEQCASNEEANEESTVVEHGIEVDEEELKRDKIVEEVIISSVT